MVTNLTAIVCEATQGHYFSSVESRFVTAIQVVIGVLAIFSILSNALVIKVFLRSETISPAHLLYANISFSDELSLLSSLTQLTDNCLTCKQINSYMVTISALVSPYTMALVSIKRYYAISRPFHEMCLAANANSPNKHRRKLISKPFLWTYLQIAIIWICAIATVLPVYNYGQAVTCESGNLYSLSCANILDTAAATIKVPWISIVTIVAIPSVITSIFTILAVIILYRRKAVGDASLEVQQQFTRRKLRSIILIVSIFLAFVICWLPITLIYTFIFNANLEEFTCDIDYMSWSIYVMVLMIHYAINPVIYWLLNSDFQQGVQSVIKQMDCRQRCRTGMATLNLRLVLPSDV